MEKKHFNSERGCQPAEYDYHIRIDKLKAVVRSNFGFILNIIEEYFYMFGLENVVTAIKRTKRPTVSDLLQRHL